MKLSIRSQYACLAIIHLTENRKKGFVRIEDIAKRKKIPKKFLEKILVSLKGGGYLRSRRGNEGGYELLKSPKKISVAEIVRLMDGPLAPVDSASQYFYGHTPIERSRKLSAVLKDIRNYISGRLEKVSFDDLIR